MITIKVEQDDGEMKPLRIENTDRRADDFYETPTWLTRAIVPYLPDLVDLAVLEPAYGGGAIANELNAAKLRFIDINATSRGVQRADFLALEPEPVFDLVITNPPYKLAEEFCRRSFLWLRPGGIVCMLLRLSFLGSQGRAQWLRENTPSICVTPRRPSFTGTKTDATEYAWFIWDGKPPTVKILETESPGKS